jgi:hypothetical protein
MKRTYQDKFKNIETWAEIVDHYWHLYQGDMYNREDMWENTLHAMTNDDWWDWCDIEPAIKIQHEQHYSRYPKLRDDTKDIYRRLQLGQPITKKNGKNKNFTAFRALMAIHDLMNDIHGRPTQHYDPPKVEPQPSPFHSLFDV